MYKIPSVENYKNMAEKMLNALFVTFLPLELK